MNRSLCELRKLLSGQCVVALDTNILSKFERETPPKWFDQVVEMQKAGVRFSIPDLCIGEHLKSYDCESSDFRERMHRNWERMVLLLKKIIWEDLPCLPMKGVLYNLVGVYEHEKTRASHEKRFSSATSKALYDFFIHYDHDNKFNRLEYRAKFAEEIKKGRQSWNDRITCLRQWGLWDVEKLTRQIKERVTLQLTEKEWAQLVRQYIELQKEQLCKMILLFHSHQFSLSNQLEFMWRVAIEYAADLDYNPFLEHCRFKGHRVEPENDGLDYLILQLTMASINICSCDGFFHNARTLNMPSSRCCLKPETLYDEWRRESGLPLVSFPTAGNICGWNDNIL